MARCSREEESKWSVSRFDRVESRDCGNVTGTLHVIIPFLILSYSEDALTGINKEVKYC